MHTYIYMYAFKCERFTVCLPCFVFVWLVVFCLVGCFLYSNKWHSSLKTSIKQTSKQEQTVERNWRMILVSDLYRHLNIYLKFYERKQIYLYANKINVLFIIDWVLLNLIASRIYGLGPTAYSSSFKEIFN